MSAITSRINQKGGHLFPLLSATVARGRGLVLLLMLLLVVVALGGCSLLYKKPTVTIGDIRVSDFSSEGLKLDVELMVQNPNSFGITVHGYRYNLALNGIPFSSGNQLRDVTLLPSATTSVRLPAAIPYAAILQLVSKQLDYDRVPYEIEGDLDVSTSFTTRRIPVKSSGTFAIPKRYRPDRYMRQLERLLAPGRE